MLAIMAMKYDGEILAEELPEGMHIGWTIKRPEKKEGFENTEDKAENKEEE